MLHAVGLVGGLDVHKGHGGGLSSILRVFFVTEDFHTLDPTKSESESKGQKISKYNIF